jgi:hypothetical protein
MPKSLKYLTQKVVNIERLIEQRRDGNNRAGV